MAADLCDAARALVDHPIAPVVAPRLWPQRVIITEEGRARCEMPAHAALHELGPARRGTVFEAPEIALGEARTHAATVYEIGALLHALLVGLPSASRRGERLPPPSTLREDAIPSALDSVVYWSTAETPGNRYVHAGELWRELVGLGIDLQRGRTMLAARMAEAGPATLTPFAEH